MADERARRIGENEALFRRVNNAVEELNEARQIEQSELRIVCECGDEACVEQISLSLHEYRALRADPTQFGIRPGHQDESVEQVIAKTPRYWTVKKPGEHPRALRVSSTMVEQSACRRLLAQAAERVEAGWCQGADARDQFGASVDPWSQEARSWSLLGALVGTLEAEAALQEELPLTDLICALAALAHFVDDDWLGAWNDAPARLQGHVAETLRAAAECCDDAVEAIDLAGVQALLLAPSGSPANGQ